MTSEPSTFTRVLGLGGRIAYVGFFIVREAAVAARFIPASLVRTSVTVAPMTTVATLFAPQVNLSEPLLLQVADHASEAVMPVRSLIEAQCMHAASMNDIINTVSDCLMVALGAVCSQGSAAKSIASTMCLRAEVAALLAPGSAPKDVAITSVNLESGCLTLRLSDTGVAATLAFSIGPDYPFSPAAVSLLPCTPAAEQLPSGPPSGPPLLLLQPSLYPPLRTPALTSAVTLSVAPPTVTPTTLVRSLDPYVAAPAAGSLARTAAAWAAEARRRRPLLTELAALSAAERDSAVAAAPGRTATRGEAAWRSICAAAETVGGLQWVRMSPPLCGGASRAAEADADADADTYAGADAPDSDTDTVVGGSAYGTPLGPPAVPGPLTRLLLLRPSQRLQSLRTPATDNAADSLPVVVAAVTVDAEDPLGTPPDLIFAPGSTGVGEAALALALARRLARRWARVLAARPPRWLPGRPLLPQLQALLQCRVAGAPNAAPGALWPPHPTAATASEDGGAGRGRLRRGRKRSLAASGPVAAQSEARAGSLGASFGGANSSSSSETGGNSGDNDEDDVAAAGLSSCFHGGSYGADAGVCGICFQPLHAAGSGAGAGRLRAPTVVQCGGARAQHACQLRFHATCVEGGADAAPPEAGAALQLDGSDAGAAAGTGPAAIAGAEGRESQEAREDRAFGLLLGTGARTALSVAAATAGARGHSAWHAHPFLGFGHGLGLGHGVMPGAALCPLCASPLIGASQ